MLPRRDYQFRQEFMVEKHRSPVNGAQDYWEQLGLMRNHLGDIEQAPQGLTMDQLPLGSPINWALYHGTFHRDIAALEARSHPNHRHEVCCFTFDPLIASAYGVGRCGLFRSGAAWRLFHVQATNGIIFSDISDGPTRNDAALQVAIPSPGHRARTHPLAFHDKDLLNLAHHKGFDGAATWDIVPNEEREHLTVHLFREATATKLSYKTVVDHEVHRLEDATEEKRTWRDVILMRPKKEALHIVFTDQVFIQRAEPGDGS